MTDSQWRQLVDYMRSTDVRLATISEQLKPVDDHERRIRLLERAQLALGTIFSTGLTYLGVTR